MKKVILSIFLIAFSFEASAATDKEAVRKFVDNVGNKIVTIANQKNLTESKKRSEIIAIVDSVIDAEWIARFVLGKNYKTISDTQKEEFRKLYRSFMINTYGPKFKNYNGRKFTVNEVAERNNFYIAKAIFLPRDSDVEINVDFRVRDEGSKLAIVDFTTEGVSLIETQRSEFNSAISEKGVEGFLVDLRARVERLKKEI